MKQFLKFTLATMVGIIIITIISTIFTFVLLGAIAASSQKPVKLKPNSVYELVLEGQLADRSEDDPFSAALAGAFGQSVPATIGLDDILSNIEKAKNNENIEGIYLRGGTLLGGFASIKEIRDALLDFKETGKFILAYADAYTQSNYYLATVADKMLLNPYGMVDFKGISAELVFFKNTLEKLGVDMQVVRVGTFKSAIEPFTETKMSDANREQITAYTSSLWKTMLDGISTSRNIDVETLNRYADELMTFQPTAKLIEYAMVDSLVYRDEVDSIMKSFVEDYRLVKHSNLTKVPDGKKFSRDKIAVIYAVGGIDDGSRDGIVSQELVKTINSVKRDKSVKSVVFRISSPGGSAYGSEQIWRALTKLKEEKPLIVSMGNYAASGGYYIACMADSILAQPNTITGSIGIFGLIPNLDGLNKKLGLNYDVVKTNKMSDALSTNRAFRPEERALMQTYINSGYELFIQRCADGRGMTTDQIKAVAEGRVWTGEDALALGLVDKLGNLSDAIAIAAEKAGLTEYQVRDFPEKEDFTTRLLKNLGGDLEARILKSQMGEHYHIYKHLRSFEYMNGIQARLPYEVVFR